VGYVLDASAVIAAIKGEKGGEFILPLLSNSVISTVNLSEVLAYCFGANIDIAVLNDYYAAGLKIMPFTAKQAKLCAELRLKTRQLGLSLGDRACLTLGLIKKYEVITADRVWAQLDIATKITIIR
jgi:ribonuclease VapC